MARAREDKTIFYSELVKAVPKLNMKGPSRPLYLLLDIISQEEVDLRGGRMISAMVVHKKEPIEPGKGFFDLARKLFPGRLRDGASPGQKHSFWKVERQAAVKWALSQPE